MEPTGDLKIGPSYDKSTAGDLQKLFKSIDALNNKVDDLNNKVDALNHKIDSSTNESDAFKHETRSRFNELKSATDEQTKLIRRVSDEIQQRLSLRDQTESHDPIQCRNSKHTTKNMRGETTQKTQQDADALPRSTGNRTSPLGGNSPNNSMTEWSMLGPCGGGYDNSPGAMANKRITKDDSVGSSQSTSTLTPSKVLLNNSCSEDRDSLSFRSTDTDTYQKTVEGETSTPDTSLITTSFKRNAGEGSSYYTEGSEPSGNGENFNHNPTGSNLHVSPMGADTGDKSTYREREPPQHQEGPTPSTSLDPTAIKQGYASTYNENESQIIESTQEPQSSANLNQNAIQQDGPQRHGDKVTQGPEAEGPNTDVAVVGVRADGESTYYNEGHQVPPGDRQDGPRAQTQLRTVSIKSGDSSTMDIEDSAASQGPSANSSNIDVRSHGARHRQGEDSAYHTDGSQRSGSDLKQVLCPESPTSPVTSLGPNVGNTVSFYENRESADQVTNEPMGDKNSRDPIGLDGDSGTANREDRQLDVPDQPSCPVCHLKFTKGTPEEVLHAHVNRHFDGSMVKSAQTLPRMSNDSEPIKAFSRQASDAIRPEPCFSRPMPTFAGQAQITSRPKPDDSPKSQNISRPIPDNTPKTPNISRPAPDTSRPAFDTKHPPPNASRPKPLLCIMCPKSFPANQQREYEAHVQTHVV